MLSYIIKNAKDNYKILEKIINKSKNKNDLINRLRQEDIIIDEYKNVINIIKDELKIIVNTKNGVEIDKILVYDENYEEYVNLF